MKSRCLYVFIFVISTVVYAQKQTSTAYNDSPKINVKPFTLGEYDLPNLYGEVSDYEELFTLEELEHLTQMVIDFEERTGVNMAVVSLYSTGKYSDFNRFAYDLSNYNDVIVKNNNSGFSVVFSIKLRKIRICTGSKVEEVLSDLACKEVIDNIFIPAFKKGEYYKGLEKGLKTLFAHWD